MKKFLIISAAIFVATISSFAQTPSGQKNSKITTIRLADNIYLLQPPEDSDAGNVVALIGSEGILLIDSGLPNTVVAYKDAINSLNSPNPTIKYIIYTHWHRDHTGGNKLLGENAVIIAQEATRSLMFSKQTLLGSTIQPAPDSALPKITFRDSLTLNFDGEIIKVSHHASAHTGGDAVVFFTKAKVIDVGDLYYGKVLPWVDFDHGGELGGLRQALQEIIALPDIKTIVAGHGPVISVKELEEERRVIDESFAIVRQGLSEGLSLKEIQSKGIGAQWKSWEWIGNSIPAWIQSVHRSLMLGIQNQKREDAGVKDCKE